MKTFFASKANDEHKLVIVDQYETASAVGSLISGLGWVVVVLPIMAAVSMLTGSPGPIESMIMTIAATAGVSLAGLVVVAIGQITRAVVDTANNTRAMRERMDRQVEPSTKN